MKFDLCTELVSVFGAEKLIVGRNFLTALSDGLDMKPSAEGVKKFDGKSGSVWKQKLLHESDSLDIRVSPYYGIGKNIIGTENTIYYCDDNVKQTCVFFLKMSLPKGAKLPKIEGACFSGEGGGRYVISGTPGNMTISYYDEKACAFIAKSGKLPFDYDKTAESLGIFPDTQVKGIKMSPSELGGFVNGVIKGGMPFCAQFVEQQSKKNTR